MVIDRDDEKSPVFLVAHAVYLKSVKSLYFKANRSLLSFTSSIAVVVFCLNSFLKNI